MTGIVDLRSDTVTRPTAAMRRAMADAEVGDDGMGEDPTINRLEAVFAERVGKEAAVFVPSGTMGNQIALRLLGERGTSIVAGRRQHVVAFERGAAAANGWAQLQPVDDTDGTIAAADVAYLIEAGGPHHWLPVGAVCVENSHMVASGAPWPLDRLDAIAALGLPVHMDGARLFNAEVATGIAASDFTARATTVMSCLSKGLAAPAGSLLAGPADLIGRARVERKIMGGGMRQVGILAAAGLVALETMIDRLADDHTRARALAEAVAARWPDCGLEPASVRTNIVVFSHPDAAALLDHLAANGVLAGTVAPGAIRLCVHIDVDDDGIERAVKALSDAS